MSRRVLSAKSGSSGADQSTRTIYQACHRSGNAKKREGVKPEGVTPSNIIIDSSIKWYNIYILFGTLKRINKYKFTIRHFYGHKLMGGIAKFFY